ncbi:MAG: 6-carboxytetrahydropterin synthase QueD [Gammaproteobacteria bacterium]|nr:6-carboxytetrahydropterin synthase QueD [Gammaproteobacteria bacterium]
MSAKYTIKVVTDFAAAHVLHGYPGVCSQLHGHNWKIETQVVATRLDDIGMGVDFKVVKGEINKIIDRLDHRYLNEIPPFDSINPTAENIAAYMYAELAKAMNQDHIQVKSITVWETERACVTYSEDDE